MLQKNDCLVRDRQWQLGMQCQDLLVEGDKCYIVVSLIL
jgi:hypothetical protein